MKKLSLNLFTDLLLVFLLLGGLYLLLRPNAPKQVEGAFYAVKFVDDNGHRYSLFGDGFSCAPIEDLPLDYSCRTTFEGELLAVRIRYQDDERRFLSYCAINYGDEAVDCRPSFGYESPLPYVVTNDSLGLSEARFAELREVRPFLQWPESVWMNWLLAAAVLLGTVIAGWRFLRFHEGTHDQPIIFKILSTMLTAFIAFVVTYFLANLSISFLVEGGNGPYWLSPIIALVAAIGIVVWRLQVYRGWRPKFGRIAYSMAGGMTILMLTYFFGLLALLSLGFVD